MKFKDKHILITGASSGIGKETALKLAQENATLTIVARNESLLKDLVIELKKICPNNHSYILTDLSDEKSIQALAQRIENVDGVVHAAGIVSPLPVKFIQKKHLDKIYHINLYAPILLTGSLLKNKKINASGSIVFISSISTDHPYFGGSMYTSSKAGIEAYSRNLALEVASKKIRSNVLAPALVNTRILKETIAASDEKAWEEYQNQYPFGIGQPEDVANSILFFLSDDSQWITGQKLVLDGGLSLNHK